MNKSFTTLVEKRFGCLWVILPGSIDMDNYKKIEERIEPELSRPGEKVVLDFLKTDSLFSSGLGVIIRLQKRINELGGSLFLVNFSKRLRQGLENVGLEKLFITYSTEEEFVKELNLSE